MHPSRVFLNICLSFIGGLGLSSAILLPNFISFGIIIFGVTLVFLSWKNGTWKSIWSAPNPDDTMLGSYARSALPMLIIIGLYLIAFGAGIYRHQAVEQPQDNFDYYQKYYANNAGDETGLIESDILKLKNKLSEVIDASLSPPHSSILGALMLGENERLYKDLKEKLNVSGTRHIIAISGMHVIILANMLIGLGIILGMWRQKAFYFALTLIILFIIMVGSPPSAIRAGIMGGIVLFAQKIGRISQAPRLLVIAAAIMLFINPALLEFDIGFQLSFLATLGIVKISPYLMEKLTFIPKFFEIRNTVSMTIPAVIFTAPILASNFGQLSLISLFTNILVIPVLSLVFGLGLLTSIIGIVFPTISKVAFLPIWLLLEYSYKVIDISARVPYASITIDAFPWYLTFLYFGLVWWVIRYFKLER